MPGEAGEGLFRPSLVTKVWVVLLFYGDRVILGLPLLEDRGVRRLAGG